MSTKDESNKKQSHLPADKLPTCWDEEDRMNVLFSPFRSRTANPQGWASKYKFWQKIIYDLLSYQMQCSFSICDLKEAFQRKGCRPLCLSTVVDELYRNQEIILETDFVQNPCDTWTSWSINMFVKRPLTWSFSKIKSYVITTDINEETRYIHLPVLKDLANNVLHILHENGDNILVPFTKILEHYRHKISKTIAEDTIMLSLIWLKRANKVDYKSLLNEDDPLVKLMAHPKDNIKDIEETLYVLKKQEDKLVKDIYALEEEKINIINETKTLLNKGLRKVAKAHLRKKMEIEKTIDKRAQLLDNLCSLISSIQDSHSNINVLSAYKIGADALKKLNESGLTESNVREIIDELSDSIYEQKEVQTLLSDTLRSSESDIDLEQELEELLNLDDKTELEEQNIPTVPTVTSVTVNELEQRLKNLSAEDSNIQATKIQSKSDSNIRKKRLQEAEPA